MFNKHPDIPMLGSVPILKKPKIPVVQNKQLSNGQLWKQRYILCAGNKVIEKSDFGTKTQID